MKSVNISTWIPRLAFTYVILFSLLCCDYTINQLLECHLRHGASLLKQVVFYWLPQLPSLSYWDQAEMLLSRDNDEEEKRLSDGFNQDFKFNEHLVRWAAQMDTHLVYGSGSAASTLGAYCLDLLILPLLMLPPHSKQGKQGSLLQHSYVTGARRLQRTK